MTARPPLPPTADHPVGAGDAGGARRDATGGAVPWSPLPHRDRSRDERWVERPGRRWPALLVAVLAALGVVATWQVFVLTRTGQLVDQAAFDGAVFGRNRLWLLAEPVLEVVSVPFVGIVLVSAMLVAVLRSRALLAVQVAVLVGGSNVTTQLLKHLVLTRSDEGIGTSGNTLPSGHTTVAASVSVALLLVVPRRLRPAAALVGVVYTTATGISTLVGRWHRPSDAVAAVLVVLAWAGLAVALGEAYHRAPVGQVGRRRVVGIAVLLLAGAAVAGLGAAVALRLTVARLDGALITERGELLTAYGGGALGVAAVVCAAFAVVLLLLDVVEPHVTRVRGRRRRAASLPDRTG